MKYINLIFSFLVLSTFLFTSCKEANSRQNIGIASYERADIKESEVISGAERVAKYFPTLEGKSVALVVNQTSRIGETHLVDTLLELGVDIKRIFSPEHGFRGTADAGEKIENDVDKDTGLPLISLYGKNKKPRSEDLDNIEIVVFDIQDVGVRFYTYISTLHYVMEACAENDIPLIVLDRPNPNGHYVDGPVLEKAFSSFVGMHPVPVVYGMTIGEYAKMINGEKWLDNGIQCDLTVIPCNNYNHNSFYELPVRPSPNLPNIRSILLYPSLCFFEGTTISVGRGTEFPFQQIGHPSIWESSYVFMPKSGPGSKYPKHQDQACYGMNLQTKTIGSLRDLKRLDLSYLITYHNNLTKKNVQFWNENNFFDKLAGTDKLKKQIIEGKSEDEIRDGWKAGLEAFDLVRSQYLIYN